MSIQERGAAAYKNICNKCSSVLSAMKNSTINNAAFKNLCSKCKDHVISLKNKLACGESLKSFGAKCKKAVLNSKDKAYAISQKEIKLDSLKVGATGITGPGDVEDSGSDIEMTKSCRVGAIGITGPDDVEGSESDIEMAKSCRVGAIGITGPDDVEGSESDIEMAKSCRVGAIGITGPDDVEDSESDIEMTKACRVGAIGITGPDDVEDSESDIEMTKACRVGAIGITGPDDVEDSESDIEMTKSCRVGATGITGPDDVEDSESDIEMTKSCRVGAIGITGPDDVEDSESDIEMTKSFGVGATNRPMPEYLRARVEDSKLSQACHNIIFKSKNACVNFSKNSFAAIPEVLKDKRNLSTAVAALLVIFLGSKVVNIYASEKVVMPPVNTNEVKPFEAEDIVATSVEPELTIVESKLAEDASTDIEVAANMDEQDKSITEEVEMQASDVQMAPNSDLVVTNTKADDIDEEDAKIIQDAEVELIEPDNAINSDNVANAAMLTDSISTAVDAEEQPAQLAKDTQVNISKNRDIMLPTYKEVENIGLPMSFDDVKAAGLTDSVNNMTTSTVQMEELVESLKANSLKKSSVLYSQPVADEDVPEVKEASKLIAAGKFNEAEKLLLTALVDNPENLLARESLALIYFNTDRLGRASSMVEQGLESAPDNVGLLKMKVKLEVAKKDFSKARAAMLAMPKPKLVEDPEYFILLADIERQLGNNRSAIDIYSAVLTYYPGNAKWWIGLGLSLERIGDLSGALESYNKALKLNNLNYSLREFLYGRISFIKNL